MRREGILEALLLLTAVSVVLGQTDLAQTDMDQSFIASRKKLWTFQNVVRPSVPRISDPWIRNPIDAFLLQGLNENQLTPSRPLDKTALIRRVTYDLTGLPPA